jgi:hypothetical protein
MNLESNISEVAKVLVEQYGHIASDAHPKDIASARMA